MGKASKSRNGAVIRHFRATLERMQSRLNWTIIRVPFDAPRAFGVRGGQINVKGEVNGFQFRTCLFPAKAGGHILLVNKNMQKAARVSVGVSADFRLEPDPDKRITPIPAPLKRILDRDRPLCRWYERLNQSMRNDIAKWVSEPKRETARAKRAEQIAERLLAVIDAERELPPVLQIAFARNPRAREGWERMSPARRRSHLFGIFYYRTPESRMRRIEKMMDEAAEKAG